MAKRKPSVDYPVSDVEEMEKLTMKKANKALTTIESALAAWDASEEKPEDMAIVVNRLRFFHNALSEWEKKMLVSISKGADISERVERLREFSDICHTYAR